MTAILTTPGALHRRSDVPGSARMAFRLDGAAQGPHRAFEVQLAGVGLGDHAVEVAARRGPEMLLLLGRDDRQRDRGQLAAHGEAGVAPEGFRDAEVVPQPVGGIDDVRPGRVGAPQIGLELRRRAAPARPGGSRAPCPSPAVSAAPALGIEKRPPPLPRYTLLAAITVSCSGLRVGL